LSAAVAVHVAEALLAAKCALALQLPARSALGWAALTLLGGNGTLRVVQEVCARQSRGKPKGH
jgi:hypothetical protein